MSALPVHTGLSQAKLEQLWVRQTGYAARPCHRREPFDRVYPELAEGLRTDSFERMYPEQPGPERSRRSRRAQDRFARKKEKISEIREIRGKNNTSNLS